MSKRILSLLAILTLSGCATPIDDSAPVDEEGEEEVEVGSAEDDDSAPVDEEGEENVGSAQDAVTGTSCSSMNTEAMKVLAAINDIRTKMGMPALNCSDTIQKAAIAHAKYQGINDLPGHQEIPGKPGFTGAHFSQRMDAAGYNGIPMTEVICAGCGGIQAVDAFMNSVYHRTPFVSFYAKSYGFGRYVIGGLSQYATIDFGAGGSAPSATKRVVWPSANATGVPTTFDCTTESPNPCDAGLTEVGSPISLTGGSNLTVTSTKLVKAGTATGLALMVRKNSNDSKIPPSQVYMIPKSPLKPATTYTATVKGSLNNTSFTKTWSFTTQ